MSDKALICDIKSQQAKVVDIMLAHQAGRIITEAVLSHESSENPPSFGRHILRYFNNHQRVDVVFDTYSSESIKSGTREKRGEGKRRKVNSETKVPGNWQDFLRVSQNKEELFKVISERLLEQLKLPPVRHKHFK